ncbi:MAG: hypothetical protein ACXWF3_13205 [Solirubrobacterales bacterium]
MEPATAQTSRPPAPVRWLLAVLDKLRRIVGALLQLAQRNEIVELGEQTRRLGSASIESATYVSGELQAVEARLASVEQELAALRKLLEERQPD